jgi:hypothetical protein
MLISNPKKIFYKNSPQKVINKTNFTNMSKSKRAHFNHFLFITLLIGNFVQLFQRSKIQHMILRCWIPIFNVSKTIFFMLISAHF